MCRWLGGDGGGGVGLFHSNYRFVSRQNISDLLSVFDEPSPPMSGKGKGGGWPDAGGRSENTSWRE